MFKKGQLKIWTYGLGLKGEINLINRQFALYSRKPLPETLHRFVSPKSCNKADTGELKSLYHQKVPIAQLARVFNVHKDTIRRRLDELELRL